MTNPATGTASKLVSNEIAGADENITSEIGKGTVVTLWLPVATELASDPS